MPFSYDIKPEVKIAASAEKVWEKLIHAEEWWLASNPEHIRFKILEEGKTLKEGTKLSIREKIAGIPCRAEGVVTEMKEQELVTWEATYYLLGLSWLKVYAGVHWKLKDLGSRKSALMANVWAHFPKNPLYFVLWFFFKNVLNGIKKDYDHAMKELQYLQQKLEVNNGA